MKNEEKSEKHTIVFPGHMTEAGVMLCSSLAGHADWLDMKEYWQNEDDGVADRPAGPPGRTGFSGVGLGLNAQSATRMCVLSFGFIRTEANGRSTETRRLH
jgi:hypothetical protein